MESSFSGTSKRSKAPSNSTQIANCLVDGCNADLSLCRDYHRRHKVCEIHSKTPKVTIGGREQRFCQQCSRFHSLVEFDDGKRSCRKRLDGHNRRRRKPQPDTLPRNSGISMTFSNHTGVSSGTTLLSFSSPQVLSSSVVSSSSSSWPGVVKPENDMAVYSSQHHLNYNMERQNHNPLPQLRFMQNSEAAATSQKIYSDGLNQVVDSDRALSLLSSAPTVTREFGLIQTEQHLPPAQPQSLVHHNLQHYSGVGQFSFPQESSKPVVSAVDADSHGSDASTLHFPEMFQQGTGGSSAIGSHQTLTFMWE